MLDATISPTLRSVGRHMERHRYQQGSVEKTDTKPLKWRPKWRNVVVSLYDCHFRETIATKRLHDITRADCQAWLNSKVHLSQSVIHKCRTQLCAILQQAYAQDLVEKNRAADLVEPKSKVAFEETPALPMTAVVRGCGSMTFGVEN